MMKLYTSLTSPYGRKCRLAAYAAGVADRVAVTEVDYKDAGYRAVNPLGKVPALEREDGSVLIDSPVICAYLASLGDGSAMYPQGDARWDALGLEALADGITDAGVLIFLERKREAARQSPAWMDLQAGKINAGLDALDARAADFGDAAHIGVLAAAACVSWLAFRAIVPDILEGRADLAAWLARFSATDAMTATAPPPGA